MKPLKVDFLPKRRLPAGAWYVTAGLLFALAAQQAWQGWRLQGQARSAEAEVAHLLLQGKQARSTRLLSRGPPPYAKDAAETARVAAFPIERVFAAIESAQVPGVKMTALDIAPADRTVRAELQFSEYAALARYLEAINAGEIQPHWALVQAHAGVAGAPGTAAIVSRWD